MNGKVRDKVNINNDMSEDQIKELTLKRPNILKWTGDRQIGKIIIVKGKIMNIVVQSLMIDIAHSRLSLAPSSIFALSAFLEIATPGLYFDIFPFT